MTASQETPEDRARRRLRIAQAKSDLAYFQARLALIGEPQTLNQFAQQRAFQMLDRVMGQKLSTLSDRDA